MFVRAGDDSFHEQWLAQDPGRNWDCLTSYYGKGIPASVAGDGVVTGGFGKLDHFKTMYEAFPRFFEHYRYIWIADPDLELAPGGISRLFGIAERYGLDLSQPALTGDSYWSFPHTLRHSLYLFRKTNFVEVMCPLFSRDALRSSLHWFDLNRSTWGTDVCWSFSLAGHMSLAIIDDVTVRHGMPIDLKAGAWYAKLRAEGVDPFEELERAVSTVGAHWFRARSFLWKSVPAPGVSRVWAFVATHVTTSPIRVRQLHGWIRDQLFRRARLRHVRVATNEGRTDADGA